MALKRKDINRGGNSNLNGYDEDTDEDEDFRSDDEESPVSRAPPITSVLLSSNQLSLKNGV